MAATRYMHNPDLWGLVRFASSSSSPTAKACRDPNFPPRHVLFNAQRAMVSHYLLHGTYPTTLDQIIACGAPCCNATTSCDPNALKVAASAPAVFNVSINTRPGSCVDYAAFTVTGGPCYDVAVDFANPGTGHRSSGTTREDRYTAVDDAVSTPCL